jgi:hypothetical protein
MLDIAVSYNRYKFLGYEYLTWLWFIIEKDQYGVGQTAHEPLSLQIGNRMVLENRQKGMVENITIKGDDASLEEAMLALRKGAVVTELHLVCKIGDQEWRFTMKGESLHMGSLQCPRTGSVYAKEDLEGTVLEKVYLYEKIFQLTDKLFNQFITLRVSEDWAKKVVPLMKQWMHS